MNIRDNIFGWQYIKSDIHNIPYPLIITTIMSEENVLDICPIIQNIDIFAKSESFFGDIKIFKSPHLYEVSVGETPIDCEFLTESFDSLFHQKIGAPVRVIKEGNEYLGLILGNLPNRAQVQYDQDEKTFFITPLLLPHFYVPELNHVLCFTSFSHKIIVDENFVIAKGKDFMSKKELDIVVSKID